MTRRTNLLLLSVALYGVAWFILVVKGGTTLAQGGLPGWQAFRVSLSSIWPYGPDFPGHTSDATYLTVLAVASGLSNVVFVALALLGSAKRRVTGAVWATLVICAIINTHWFVLNGDRMDLRPGYYLWAASYFVLAAALRRDA